MAPTIDIFGQETFGWDHIHYKDQWWRLDNDQNNSSYNYMQKSMAAIIWYVI